MSSCSHCAHRVCVSLSGTPCNALYNMLERVSRALAAAFHAKEYNAGRCKLSSIGWWC